jgi:hypothetical protein
MAKYIFIESDTLANKAVFNKMREEVKKMLIEFDALFFNYQGSFEFTLDKTQPKARYIHVTNEDTDSMLLETYILFLDRKLLQIANDI